MAADELSPRGARLMAIALIASGLMTIWAGMRSHAVAAAGVDQVPAWIPVCAGLFFITGGAIVIVNFGTKGRVGADGQMPADVPLAIRVAGVMLNLAFVALLGALVAWIGFGPGGRQFSASTSLPFVSWLSAGNEAVGRVFFGGFALLLAAVFVGTLAAALRRISGRS